MVIGSSALLSILLDEPEAVEFLRAIKAFAEGRISAAGIKPAVKARMTVDCSECELVERVAGKVGGRPAVKGTGTPAGTIIVDEERGATVEESFPSQSLGTILSIRAHSRTQLNRV